MTRKEILQQIQTKKSYLCVGLDSDLSRIPRHLLKYDDPVFEFNKQIIDATKDLCVSYKPNLAFYESRGVKGWQSLEKTMNYIPTEHFTIADKNVEILVIPQKCMQKPFLRSLILTQ